MRVGSDWLGHLVLQIDLGLPLVVILDDLLQVSVRVGHSVDEKGFFRHLPRWTPLLLLLTLLSRSIAPQGCVVNGA